MLIVRLTTLFAILLINRESIIFTKLLTCKDKITNFNIKFINRVIIITKTRFES